ncbi:MAG: flippase [Chitinophagaceae bacterium]
MNPLKRYGGLIQSGFYTAVQKVATLLIGILSFMLLARMLGPAGYGVWGLFMVISSIAETSRTAITRNAFIRFMHQSPDEQKPSIQGAALALSFFISAAMGLLFVIASYLLSFWSVTPELAELLRWYAVIILVSSFFSSMEMLLNAKLDFRGICFMYCVRQGLFMILVSICYVAGFHLELWMLSVMYLGAFIAGTLVGMWFAKRYIAWDFHHLRSWFPRLLNFGKYVFGTNISSLLFRSTDNFMTFTYFGAAVSGLYNACLRISNLIDLPSQVIADIMFPRAAKYNAADSASVKTLYEKSVGAILVFSLPALLFVLIFPAFILQVLAGPGFVVAVPILRVTAFFGFTLPFLKQFGMIMDATGLPHVNFRVMLFSFLVNIVNNIVGIYLFGLIGAAIGTATTYFMSFLFSQYLLKKKFGINVSNVFVYTFHFYKELFTVVRLYPKRKQA